MPIVILILLVAWAILTIIGFAMKGLVWLGIIGVVLFIGTVVFAIIWKRSKRQSS